MKSASPRILTINGGSSSIKCALFEAADSLDMFSEIEKTLWEHHQTCRLSSLSSAILLCRRTKGIKPQTKLTEDR
jgi:acetate kinase